MTFRVQASPPVLATPVRAGSILFRRTPLIPPLLLSATFFVPKARFCSFGETHRSGREAYVSRETTTFLRFLRLTPPISGSGLGESSPSPAPRPPLLHTPAPRSHTAPVLALATISALCHPAHPALFFRSPTWFTPEGCFLQFLNAYNRWQPCVSRETLCFCTFAIRFPPSREDTRSLVSSSIYFAAHSLPLPTGGTMQQATISPPPLPQREECCLPAVFAECSARNALPLTGQMPFLQGIKDVPRGTWCLSGRPKAISRFPWT